MILTHKVIHRGKVDTGQRGWCALPPQCLMIWRESESFSGPQKDAEVPLRGLILVTFKRIQCVDQSLLVRWECAFSTDTSGDGSQDTKKDENEIHISGCQSGDTRTLDQNSGGSLNTTSKRQDVR